MGCRVINPTKETLEIPRDTPLAILTELPYGTTIEPWDTPESDELFGPPNVNGVETTSDVDDQIVNLEGEEEDDFGLQTLPAPYNEKEAPQPLKFDIEETLLDPSQKKRLLQFLSSNADLFARSDNDLGCTTLVTHKIDVGDATPVKSAPIVLPQMEERL